MAENKKGFILYADLIYTVKKLSKEDTGELFLHILKYVNDENPVTENYIVDLIFENIKLQLKRDLQKYEVRANRSRENGQKGGRPKVEENNLEKPKITQQVILEPRKPDTVNVTVTDTDTVTDNVKDILLKKETKKVSKKNEVVLISPIYPFDTENFINAWNTWKTYKEEQHKFKYKSQITEGMALKDLCKISNNNENLAIEIINKSISQGYKGLFPLQNKINTAQNGTIKLTASEKTDKLKRDFAEKFVNQIQHGADIEPSEDGGYAEFQ